MAGKEKEITILMMTLGSHDNGKNLMLVKLTEEELETGESIDLSTEDLGGAYGGWHSCRVSLFSGAAKKHFRGQPGTVYKVKAPAPWEGTIIPSSATIMALWPHQEHRAVWGAAREAVSRAQALTKASKVKAWQESLEPIREAYRGARGIHKNQILAAAVQFITS